MLGFSIVDRRRFGIKRKGAFVYQILWDQEPQGFLMVYSDRVVIEGPYFDRSFDHTMQAVNYLDLLYWSNSGDLSSSS